MKIDSKGNIYVAQWFGGKILKLSPDGKLLHVFEIAVGDGTTNVAFGEGDLLSDCGEGSKGLAGKGQYRKDPKCEVTDSFGEEFRRYVESDLIKRRRLEPTRAKILPANHTNTLKEIEAEEKEKIRVNSRVSRASQLAYSAIALATSRVGIFAAHVVGAHFAFGDDSGDGGGFNRVAISFSLSQSSINFVIKHGDGIDLIWPAYFGAEPVRWLKHSVVVAFRWADLSAGAADTKPK